MFTKSKNLLIKVNPTTPFVHVKKQINEFLIKKANHVKQSKMYFNPAVTQDKKELTRNQLKNFYESINDLNRCELLENLFYKLLNLANQCSVFMKVISDSQLNILHQALVDARIELKKYENTIRSSSPPISLTKSHKKTFTDMHRFKNEKNNHLVYLVNSHPLSTKPESEADLIKFFKENGVINPEIIEFLLSYTHQDGLLKYAKYFLDHAIEIMTNYGVYPPAKFQVNFHTCGFYELLMDHTLIFNLTQIEGKVQLSLPFLLTIRMLISQDSKHLPRVTGIETITDENNISSALKSIIDPTIKQIFSHYINEFSKKSYKEIENRDNKHRSSHHLAPG